MRQLRLLCAAGATLLVFTAQPVHADGMLSLKDTPVVVTTPSWAGYYFGGSIG